MIQYMPMISAVVLSHNDEKTIKATIESLLWCDEVILLDDFSSDRTVEIGKRQNVTVIKHRLNGDFAAQRNFGLSKTHGDWVLFVDSDEVVSQSLREEIVYAISHNEFDGHYMKRKDFLLGHALLHGETNKVRLLRLARKHKGLWKRPVHEVWDVEGSTGELKNPLLHYPHPTIAQFVSDIDTYSTANAQYLFRQGITSCWWKIILYPIAKFWIDYVWYMGFLDGTAGCVMAMMMSFHSFLTRAKLYLAWHSPRSARELI